MSENEPMFQWFEYKHLPPELQLISIPFYEMANNLISILPDNPQRTMALWKLLESKDCAVRASLYKNEK